MNGHGQTHIDYVKTYVFVLLALLLATVLTTVVAYQPLGAFSVVVALVNGVMTYAAAVGVNTVATAASPSGVAAAPLAARSYRWWS